MKKKPDRRIVAASLAFLVGAATAAALGRSEPARPCAQGASFDPLGKAEGVMLKQPERRHASLGRI